MICVKVLILKNRFIFLCTPRTGSRAIVNALKTLGDAKESREHHVHPEDVKSTAESLFKGSSTLPKVTVLRNPYEQVLSWFGHVVLRHEPQRHTIEDFADFIRAKSVSWYFDRQLNPYLLGMEGVHAVKFDKTHLQKTVAGMLAHINTSFGTRMSTPRLSRVGGAFSPSPDLLNETTIRLIEERFPADVELWNNAKP